MHWKRAVLRRTSDIVWNATISTPCQCGLHLPRLFTPLWKVNFVLSAPLLPVAMSSITSLDLVNLQNLNSTLRWVRAALSCLGERRPQPNIHSSGRNSELQLRQGQIYRRNSREEQGAANHSSLVLRDHKEEPRDKAARVGSPETNTWLPCCLPGHRDGADGASSDLLKVNSHCSGARRASCPPLAWDKPTNKPTN